jgi:hypothetical protein
MACVLLGVAVLGCDGRAQAYTSAAAEVPPMHWRAVPAIGIREGAHGRHDPATGIILLPANRRDDQLFHEVGHRILDASRADDGSRAIDGYCARFWPLGRPVGRPPSPYGRHSCREDGAESMRRLYERDRGWRASERARWLLAHVRGTP